MGFSFLEINELTFFEYSVRDGSRSNVWLIFIYMFVCVYRHYRTIRKNNNNVGSRMCSISIESIENSREIRTINERTIRVSSVIYTTYACVSRRKRY